MKWLIRVYSLILLGYTGWRTFDFMGSQLPKNDISFWLSIIFLFATEAGLLLWHEITLKHTTTEEQENISRWMTWIDFVGSTAAGIADMIIRQTLTDYQVPPALAQFLIYGLPVIMAVNVAAVLLYQLNDAETQIEREKKQARFEIYKAALADVRRDRKAIAAEKKSVIYQELRREITGYVDNRHGIKKETASLNGKMAIYNASTQAADQATRVNTEAPLDEAPNLIITKNGKANPTRRRQTKV